MILNEDATYSIEDFEAAGYRKVTQFPLETLPGAIDSWFGFFNQKDIEIRFYPSHQMAIDKGLEPARIATSRGAVPLLKTERVQYAAYAVVGNVVMLCELEVASCEALVAQLN